jgi:hypothetical protein
MSSMNEERAMGLTLNYQFDGSVHIPHTREKIIKQQTLISYLFLHIDMSDKIMKHTV